MPLGSGYTVEGQLTGKEEWGGLQIEVYPKMRDDVKFTVIDTPRSEDDAALQFERLSLSPQSDAQAPKPRTITVKPLAGEPITFEVDLSKTVMDLKHLIA